MDHNSSSTKVFDFSNQANIVAILVAIRKSELPTDVKNELRDLVFLYTSGGGDDSVRILLEQKLNNYKITPVSEFQTVTPKPEVVKSVEQVPKMPFGSFRPTPVFSTPVTSVDPSLPRPSVSVDTVKSAVKQFKSASLTPTPISVSDKQAQTVDSVPQNKPTTSEFVEPKKIEEKSEQDIVKVDDQKKVPAKPESEQTSDQPKSVNKKHLDRIREIKTIVNSKVGNPVNLVDINNQVGRDYMNALLEAMKKLSGNSESELGLAMQKLETAFTAVDKVVSERTINDVKQEQNPVTQVNEKVVPEPVLPTNNVQESVITKEEKKPVVEQSGFEVKSPVVDVPVVSEKRTVEAIPTVRVMGVPSTPVVPKSQNPIPQENLSAIRNNKFTSLAEEKKMLGISDLPTSLPSKTHEVGNPFYTAEIDAGLDELLSDWSLFKKSGLFGTGPKGREHPLFVKMADVQVPLILAGRFEGATQEIKQSVTDYMNGWRYEQGIIYDPSETFEMYLRRVIKHIIDLQKKSN